VIYARVDVPDTFAYDVARAMDEHQELLQCTNQNFSYNVLNVWKACDVALHPGAARSYRSAGLLEINSGSSSATLRMARRQALNYFHVSIPAESVCEIVLFSASGIEFAKHQKHASKAFDAHGKPQSH
jgi:hypothetical protein